MRAGMSMRDRVENGQGMLFVSAMALGASWFWFQFTMAPSVWWGISGALIIGSVVAVGRSVYLILSGFSGFGRNFHEEPEPLDPSPEDESYDHDTAVKSAAAHVWAGPLVLFVTGVLATAFRLFPGLMTPDGIPDPDFVPSRLLELWILVAGLLIILWAALVLVMMWTGPDRWTYVPGTRKRIRSSMWKLLLLGIVLVTIATAFTVNSATDPDNSEGRITAESLHVYRSSIRGQP